VSDDNEMVRGSGNVFHDLGLPDAGREQLRALLRGEDHWRAGRTEADGACGAEVEWCRCGGLLPHPQRQPGPLHDRPADGDPVRAWPGGGGVDRCPSASILRSGGGAGVKAAAAGSLSLRPKNTMPLPGEDAAESAKQFSDGRNWALRVKA
jgi:hypothetical protein